MGARRDLAMVHFGVDARQADRPERGIALRQATVEILVPLGRPSAAQSGGGVLGDIPNHAAELGDPVIRDSSRRSG